MNPFKKLFGRKPPAEEHVMKIGENDAVILRQSRLRKGMWVVHDGNVGILVRGFNDATGEVHLVRQSGHTYLVQPYVPLLALRQAKLEEIPESRRPSEELGRALGYVR